MRGCTRPGTWAGALVLAMAMTAMPAAARAQVRPGAAGAAGDEPTVTPFELQRMFDAYALLQAQEFLKIGDDQYARFLPRFKALQDVRRQALQQRTRVLNEVRRLVNNDGQDEQIRNALKQLQDIDERGVSEARKAEDAVDQVLDLRQQAKFRIFEEQMERRKIELVTRARQANRANNPNRQVPQQER
jgi:hypothetical protein